MKKLVTGICLIACVSAFALPANAQVLWRSAKTMKKGSYIAMVQGFYIDYIKKYDLNKEEWIDNPSDQVWSGFETMFGYAVTDRLEAMVHVPYYFKNKKSASVDVSEQGFGDIWFKTRLAILPWAKDKHGFLVTTSLRLPTGFTRSDDSFCNCGDGTVDVGLGGIYSTPWLQNFRGHLKLNYWFTGISHTGTDVGDDMKFIAKLDRNFHPQLMGFACYIFIQKWSDYDSDGAEIINKDKIRHILQLGGVYKPKEGLFIRPKVAIALGGEKRINYTYKPMIDIWYIFTT